MRSRYLLFITAAAFVAGGVIGPTVHRIQHSMEESARVLLAVGEFHDHENARIPVVCASSLAPPYRAASCILCKYSPDDLALQRVVTDVEHTSERTAYEPSRPYAQPVAFDRVRGPPLRHARPLSAA